MIPKISTSEMTMRMMPTAISMVGSALLVLSRPASAGLPGSCTADLSGATRDRYHPLEALVASATMRLVAVVDVPRGRVLGRASSSPPPAMRVVVWSGRPARGQ